MTDFQKFALAFIVVVSLFLVGGFAYKIGDRHGYKDGYNAYHPADTEWVEKTVYKDSLVEVVKWKEKDRLVYIPVKVDSLIHDTTYVALPREFKMYADSTFEAQVSGIDPALDWIRIHQKTAYITNTITEYKPYKWTLSAFAEGGAALYRFDVRAGLEYERQIAGPLRGAIRAGYEYGNIGRGVFVEGGVKLQILKK